MAATGVLPSIPKTWDEAKLADWRHHWPDSTLVRPYLRQRILLAACRQPETYPVYFPGREPAAIGKCSSESDQSL